MIIDHNDGENDEDLEKFIEGEAGVCCVRTYWFHQWSNHLLLIFHLVSPDIYLKK